MYLLFFNFGMGNKALRGLYNLYLKCIFHFGMGNKNLCGLYNLYLKCIFHYFHFFKQKYEGKDTFQIQISTIYKYLFALQIHFRYLKSSIKNRDTFQILIFLIPDTNQIPVSIWFVSLREMRIWGVSIMYLKCIPFL